MSTICLLHGYLLDGSGSNQWTRNLLIALVRNGINVELVCQEPKPELFHFVSEFIEYTGSEPKTVFSRKTEFKGTCRLHKPDMRSLLPVYLADAKYGGYDRVVPMIDLETEEVEDYIAKNVEVVSNIVASGQVDAVVAGHLVLMPTVAQRVSLKTGVPYNVIPHGSDIEYTIKKDKRFLEYATSALSSARNILCLNSEMKDRVKELFMVPQHVENKARAMNMGINHAMFQPADQPERLANVKALIKESPELPELKSLLTVDWSKAKTVGFIGKLLEMKGPTSLLAAAPLVRKEQDDSAFLFIGNGPLSEPMKKWTKELDDGVLSEEFRTITPEVQCFFESLKKDGKLDDYLASAKGKVSDCVIFTGYLPHEKLKWILPCLDATVIPSTVREVGPLVLMEAMSSGSFPLGTYFGGMQSNMDLSKGFVPEEVSELMRLSPDNADLVSDIVRKLPPAIAVSGEHRTNLRNHVIKNHDWDTIIGRFIESVV